MHSQIRLTFHGIYWRMSCGCCDRVTCFDDRGAAMLAAREHAAWHDRGPHSELILIEDAIGHGRGQDEDWALAPEPESVELDPAAQFHSSPPFRILPFSPAIARTTAEGAFR